MVLLCDNVYVKDVIMLLSFFTLSISLYFVV